MSTIYLDGKFLSAEDVRFGPALFSLNYAVCAFEGIRCYPANNGAAIFRLDAHLKRYQATCDYLGFKSNFLAKDVLAEATLRLAQYFQDDSLYIRPIAFIDEGIMQLERHPEVRSCIFAMPMKLNIIPSIVKLGIASNKRNLETISRKISLNYFDSYIGLKQKNQIFDDLLFLDSNGFVTETSAHNIFFITSSGVVVTPKETHCLAGITRDSVMKLLNFLDVEVVERDIFKDEIRDFDACFTTSTASEIRIIRSIEEINFNIDNYLFEILAKNFRMCVAGQHENFKEWNDYV